MSYVSAAAATGSVSWNKRCAAVGWTVRQRREWTPPMGRADGRPRGPPGRVMGGIVAMPDTRAAATVGADNKISE